jgi:hypothetical protein
MDHASFFPKDTVDKDEIEAKPITFDHFLLNIFGLIICLIMHTHTHTHTHTCVHHTFMFQINNPQYFVLCNHWPDFMGQCSYFEHSR